MSMARMLREFHEVMGLRAREYPTMPLPQDEGELRLALIQEEMGELAAAVEQDDLLGVLDALADIVYVAYGTALSYGVDLDAALAEVHRSNMTKVGPNGEVLRREDGKVLKPATYEPPSLHHLVRAQ